MLKEGGPSSDYHPDSESMRIINELQGSRPLRWYELELHRSGIKFNPLFERLIEASMRVVRGAVSRFLPA